MRVSSGSVLMAVTTRMWEKTHFLQTAIRMLPSWVTESQKAKMDSVKPLPVMRMVLTSPHRQAWGHLLPGMPYRSGSWPCTMIVPQELIQTGLLIRLLFLVAMFLMFRPQFSLFKVDREALRLRLPTRIPARWTWIQYRSNLTA